MIPGLTIAAIAPLLAGYQVVGRLGAAPGSPTPSRPLRAFLALGWSIGVSSCLFFAWLAAVGPPGRVYFMLETALSLLLAALAAFTSRTTRAPAREKERRGTLPRSAAGILWAALGLAVGLGASSFVLDCIEHPDGDWDALSIWNLRARFLYLGGPAWRDAFHPALITSHLDYPLLVPTSVARLWYYAGRETAVAPALVAFAFALANVGLFVSALATLRGVGQGLLGGLVLSSPMLFELGSVEAADVPLSYYFLATVVALVMGDRDPASSRRWTMLAGLMAGFAAWTKNEGLLFLAAVLAARLASVVPSRGWRAYRAEAVPFAIGLAPVLAVVVDFKVRFAPPNDLLADQGRGALLGRLAEPTRYATVGRAFAAGLLKLQYSAIAWLAAYGLLLGGRPGWAREPGVRFAILVPLLMLSGYALVYLLTPFHLPWHLQWSLYRLVIQVWPLSVFAFFLAVRTPDEALEGPRSS
jgi:hypothetical protein